MDNSTAAMKECPEYRIANILVTTFGFITFVSGIAGSLLTFVYLFLFRKVGRYGSSATNTTVTTETSSGGTDYEPKQTNLRASTQLLMAALAFVDLCGQLTSCLRYTILTLTQYDVRLFYNDAFCRLQLFAEYCSQDSSAWFMCAMTAERFWLMLFPTSGYSLDKKRIRPAFAVILANSLVTMTKNAILLAPSQQVCAIGYKFKPFFIADLVYKCALPFVILMVTSIGNLTLMQRQLIKMHSQHMNILKGLSIVTMTKQQKSALPPTTAAMWEVVFACRMMVVSGIVFLIGALPVNLFKLFDSQFPNVLTARNICSTTDVIYNAINILFWFCVGLRFYLYMFSSPRVRHDMLLILKILCVQLHLMSPTKKKSSKASKTKDNTSKGLSAQTSVTEHTSKNTYN